MGKSQGSLEILEHRLAHVPPLAKNDLFLFHVYERTPAFMCVDHVSVVTEEASRGCCVPEANYRQL